MRTNPFYDAYLFLTGTDAFHKDAGWQGAILVPVYWALLLASLSLLSKVAGRSPTESRRKPTWQAGLYDELYRDVNKTMADLNCSIKAAIAHLLKDRSGRWWTHTQQSL